MFRKFVFISVLLSIFLSGMFLTFSQEAAPPSTQPDATRRQYDHEFDRLSEEERRRLHMGRGNEEQDQSMRRSQMQVRDDAGTDSAQNNRTSSNQSNAQTNNSTREQARQNAERYMRSNYPEMSERELDEMIERMLDQLIEQLEARIENRTRVRLKRQLVSFLQRLIKKYRVDPATAEDMTRERARREIEGIRNNREQATPAARRRNSSDVRRQSSTNSRSDNESFAPPMTSESRERINNRENNTEMTPEEERRVAQAQRQNSSRQPQATRQRSTRRRQSGIARRNRDRYVEVSNPVRRQTGRSARRASARRQARRASAAQPAFAIKRFIIGSDKNGLVIKKAVPVLVTFTIHTNNGAGKYVIAAFTAISVKDRKQYKIHTTKKFLILDRRSQYQFYWSSEMDSADKLLPNGKYKIYVTAAIHNAAGRVIAKPGRLWGGTSSAMTVTTENNQQVTENQSEARPPATGGQESAGTTTSTTPPAGNNQPPASTRQDAPDTRQQ